MQKSLLKRRQGNGVLKGYRSRFYSLIKFIFKHAETFGSIKFIRFIILKSVSDLPFSYLEIMPSQKVKETKHFQHVHETSSPNSHEKCQQYIVSLFRPVYYRDCIWLMTGKKTVCKEHYLLR